MVDQRFQARTYKERGPKWMVREVLSKEGTVIFHIKMDGNTKSVEDISTKLYKHKFKENC